MIEFTHKDPLIVMDHKGEAYALFMANNEIIGCLPEHAKKFGDRITNARWYTNFTKYGFDSILDAKKYVEKY